MRHGILSYTRGVSSTKYTLPIKIELSLSPLFLISSLKKLHLHNTAIIFSKVSYHTVHRFGADFIAYTSQDVFDGAGGWSQIEYPYLKEDGRLLKIT